MKYLMKSSQNEWGINSLQNTILNIGQYIDNFCEQYQIEYCLMGGSALGAIRHQGFIPWDDDMDIFMTPDNYEKFRSSFLNYGDHDTYYLQEKGKNGLISSAKLRMNHSTYIEEAYRNLDIHHGVFVDIFILHNCPDSKMKLKWQYYWAKYVIVKGLADRGYKKTGLDGVLLDVMRLFPKHAFIYYALKQLYKYRGCQTKMLCHFMGHARLEKALYKRVYFEKTKKIAFENTFLRIPYFCEDYLKDRWGDYMKMPSMDEIEKCIHATEWSNESFKGYNKEGNYKDEWLLIP